MRLRKRWRFCGLIRWFYDWLAVCLRRAKWLLHHFTQASLTQYLATEIHYSAGRQMNGRTQQVPVDPSPNIAKTILDLGEKSGIRQLVSVVTAPTMLPDGRLLTARGF